MNNNDFKNNLKLLLIKSIKIVLKTFSKIDNIIFVSDGGSWRQKINIPSCLKHDTFGKGVEYKGNRVYDDSIDWEFIWSIYEEFLADLQLKNINVCYASGIEGDDWCWYASNKLNTNNVNCIIWTKDKDLLQLVNINNDKCFTVWWNKENGAYIKDFNEDNLNFLFNMNFGNNEILYNNIVNNSVSINKINPNHIVIEKILLGDQSDNIFPVIIKTAKNKQSSKKFKISKKDINYDLNYNNKDDVNNYLLEIYNHKKYHNLLIDTYDEICEHFQYNKQLISLDYNSYPSDIINNMDNNFKYCEAINILNSILELEKEYFANVNKLKSILDII